MTSRTSVPLGKRHERAVRIVCPQQIGDDHEEVEQAALLQRVADRLFAFALADGFVLNVRVGDALVGRRRIGFNGDHPIVAGMTVRQLAPVQADFKRAEIDAV